MSRELAPVLVARFFEREAQLRIWMDSPKAGFYKTYSLEGIRFSDWEWEEFDRNYLYYTSPLYKALL